MKKRMTSLSCLCLPLIGSLLSCARPNPTPVSVNNSSTPSAAVVKESPRLETAPNNSTTPTLGEAQNAITRVYQGAVVIDQDHPNRFILGDFNGDSSQDIAIVVKPNKEMLTTINSEFANWISEDPRKVVHFSPNKSVQPLPASEHPNINQQDTLLAIIHGYERSGWRNPDAKQSYLLKNGAGDKIEALPLKSFPPALRIISQGFRSKADVINQNTKAGSGFLFWSSGKYVWQSY